MAATVKMPLHMQRGERRKEFPSVDTLTWVVVCVCVCVCDTFVSSFPIDTNYIDINATLSKLFNKL